MLAHDKNCPSAANSSSKFVEWGKMQDELEDLQGVRVVFFVFVNDLNTGLHHIFLVINIE